jgi:hypothetical protein
MIYKKFDSSKRYEVMPAYLSSRRPDRSRPAYCRPFIARPLYGLQQLTEPRM